MTEMIERVARVLLESTVETQVVTNSNGDKWTLSWENASAKTRRQCKEIAYSAIEAMRELPEREGEAGK